MGLALTLSWTILQIATDREVVKIVYVVDIRRIEYLLCDIAEDVDRILKSGKLAQTEDEVS